MSEEHPFIEVVRLSGALYPRHYIIAAVILAGLVWTVGWFLVG